MPAVIWIYVSAVAILVGFIMIWTLRRDDKRRSRVTGILSRTEVQQLKSEEQQKWSEEMQLKSEAMQRRDAELLTRWEAVVTRLEAMASRWESRNDSSS